MRYRTGVYTLDRMLNGGLAPGLVEIWGGPAVGKTTLGYSIMRDAEQRGHLTALVHMDGLPDPVWIHNAGAADCLIPQPQTGESAFDVMYHLITHGVKILVVDTLVGTQPLENDLRPFTRNAWNAHRKLVHHSLTVLRSTAKAHGALVVILNQLRNSIGEGLQSYLYSTMSSLVDHRIRLWKRSFRTEYGRLAETVIQVEVEFLSRVYSDVEARMSLWPLVGVWPERELLLFLTEEHVLARSHNWWSTPVQDERIGPGFAGAAGHIAQYYDTYYELMEEAFRARN